MAGRVIIRRRAVAATFLTMLMTLMGCQPSEVHSIPDEANVGGKAKAEEGQGRFQPPAQPQSSAPSTPKPGAPAVDEGVQSR